jgi:hypothetical protein
MRKLGLVIAGGALLFATGCGKTAKCEKAFTNVENYFVSQMGGGDDEKADFEKHKDEFMTSCKKMTDDQISCLTGDLAKAADDPKCKDALDGLGD